MGFDGDLWACSPSWKKLRQGQRLFDPSALFWPAHQTSFVVAGRVFLTIWAADRSIYGKSGASGCCLVRTTQTVILGYHDDETQPGNCVNQVEKLADIFIANGF